MKEMLEAGAYTMLDRAKATTPEEQRAVYLQHFDSDFFFMSANALTLKGELVNIDGNSNRVACLSFGPKHVIVLVGMNKIVKDTEEGLKRVRTMRARRMPPACTQARPAKRWEYAACATSRAACAATPSSRAITATPAALKSFSSQKTWASKRKSRGHTLPAITYLPMICPWTDFWV